MPVVSYTCWNTMGKKRLDMLIEQFKRNNQWKPFKTLQVYWKMYKENREDLDGLLEYHYRCMDIIDETPGVLTGPEVFGYIVFGNFEESEIYWDWFTQMIWLGEGAPIPACGDTKGNIPRSTILPIINQMCEDTKKGDLRWFTLTPGIGQCYGLTSCNKKEEYEHVEFGNYTGTIYDIFGKGKFNLYYKDLHGWIDRDLGQQLLSAIKGNVGR